MRRTAKMKHWVWGGLEEEGELGGSVGVKRSCGSGFRRIVDPKTGPQTVGAVAKMENMPDQRKREDGQSAEGENCCNGEGRIFIVGFNIALRGDDGARATNG